MDASQPEMPPSISVLFRSLVERREALRENSTNVNYENTWCQRYKISENSTYGMTTYPRNYS